MTASLDLAGATLTLPEHLYLLSLDERGRGRVAATGALAIGFAGAALLDLHLRGHFELDPRRPSPTPRPTGEPFLDRVLDAVVGEPGPLWKLVLKSVQAVPSSAELLREAIARKVSAGVDLAALPPPGAQRSLHLAGLARACLLGALVFDKGRFAAVARELDALPAEDPFRALLDAMVYAVAAASS
ncbi:MAG: GPP34 family phosphoprotein [Deltaproteobacteria bacterium]|nr:GPP34 family phosphoprotein [Deltaproteobacteria bacterium]